MAMNFDGAFSALADDDTWMDAAEVAVGFAGPMIAANVLEGSTPFDLPNEVYGLAGVAGGEMVDRRLVSVGGGLYTVDALAQRFGLKSSVTNLGGGN
jgi:hypothetical protein